MSRMYDIIQELCRRDGTDVTKMCRALKIPRSTLSELASGRTKQLTLKHARPIAEYFGVTIAQLAGDEPLETEPDQTDAVSDLIRDEPIAAYENLKRYLTEEDKADIATLIRLRAEINQGKQSAAFGWACACGRGTNVQIYPCSHTERNGPGRHYRSGMPAAQYALPFFAERTHCGHQHRAV